MTDPAVQRGEEIEVGISAAAFEGKSVARVEGFVVFVEGAVPGDVVRARVVKRKKNFAEARTVEVLKPSPMRTTPRCSFFGTCGGCKWQHVQYASQLLFKEQHVREAFERIGAFESPQILPIIGAREQYFYRNKMEFSFSDRQWLRDPPESAAGDPPSTGVFVGLHVPRRYDKVLDLDECHLQSTESNAILNFTRAFARTSGLEVYSGREEAGFFRFLVVRQSRRTGELMVNLVTFDDLPGVMKDYTRELLAAVPQVTTVVNTINRKKAQVAFGERERVYHGEGVIREHLGGLTFTISPGSFFQTNTEQAEVLYEVTRSFAQLKPTDAVFDLYSGTGTIAIILARDAREVVGIESVESAIVDAERNARVNGITNCRFIRGDLKDRLTKDTDWMQSHPPPDVLVIDPPRSGMHPNVVEELRKLQVPRIVYVSCNPSTQARDCRMLCQDLYRLVKLQPVDMFPHTYHIESVALLELDR